MSLFVRLEVGFWTHRKTMRLRALIGDAALWLPPRLWSYAAQNQPDGDFTGYLPNELAMLLGYSNDAQAMLEALQRASFMDGMKIHDWDQHNGYHTVFAERAKKAAEARWRGKNKKGKDKRVQEKRGEETSIATSNAQASLSSVVEIWNQSGLPKAINLSGDRENHLRARLKESFWVENYAAAITKAGGSAFLKGENDKGWKITFDWFVKPGNLEKIIEGKYDNAKRSNTNSRTDSTRNVGHNANLDYSKRSAEAQARIDAETRKAREELLSILPNEGQRQPDAGLQKGA